MVEINGCRILAWKHKERRLLRSIRHRCDGNTEMGLEETGNEVVN
jgi:hypothetical protein